MEFVNSQEEKLDITCLAIVVILSPSLDHRVKHMIKDAMVFICSIEKIISASLIKKHRIIIYIKASLNHV